MARSLDELLSAHGAGGALASDVARTVACIAMACAELRDVIDRGRYADQPPPPDVVVNAAGDVQKRLDAISDEILLEGIRQSPAAAYASEEQDEPIVLDPKGRVVVAVDPLDGSSNIDTNMSIGTIFSVLPVHGGDPRRFDQPGSAQLAAGFVVYGPRTAMVLTLGKGTHVFAYDPDRRGFVETRANIAIPRGNREYAINSSNYRHWDDHVRAFVDDCVSGQEGPLANDFNMRWGASLVADAYRIFQRGGVFLYPGDSRANYSRGRLRLVYEASPIAFVAEQAGGAATTGRTRILDLVPNDLHQRTPLVFGSTDHVERVAHYYNDPSPAGNRSPLFGQRGLLRA